jgi:hypothetical protein
MVMRIIKEKSGQASADLPPVFAGGSNRRCGEAV